MKDRITYWIDYEFGKIEIVGEVAFEMYGHKFGVHREIIKGRWGDHNEFIVTDILTGRRISYDIDYDNAISAAQIRLDEKGEKEYLDAVNKILNP